jgi:uncharacterized protein
MTKVLFTTDVHGSQVCFRKFIAAADFYGADVIIMGGDCTGKMLVPMAGDDSRRTATYMDREWVLSGADEIADFERRVANAGYYPVKLSVQEIAELQADPAKVDELFVKTMKSTLSNWLVYAEEKLRGKNVTCIITPGNDDDLVIDDVLEQNDFVVAGENKVIRLDDRHELLSLGWTNPTPWATPRECDEATLRQRIDELAGQVQNMERAIFNLHAPPHGTGLDEAPELNERIEPKRGGTVMASAGSTAVREAILHYQPLMALHGHIHEARGHQKLGRTLCVNPGSTYGDGSLNGVLFELHKGKIRSHILTMG